MGLIGPTALFVVLPLVWAFNQFGWQTASQVFFWIGPFLLFVLLPSLDMRYGADGQNPPDEVMNRLENDRYYRYCTCSVVQRCCWAGKRCSPNSWPSVSSAPPARTVVSSRWPTPGGTSPN